MTIRVLISGFGQIGLKHFNFLKAQSDIQITGIVRQQVTTIENFPVYCDLKKAILETKPNLVLVCSPHIYHYEQIKIALENNCHVLVEKTFNFKFYPFKRTC